MTQSPPKVTVPSTVPDHTPEPLVSAPAGPPGGKAPLTAIDLFRGMTILEVVTHHATGMALRHLTPGSVSHDWVSALNRTLHFAVPAFMFLSAALLTRSLLRQFDLKRYVSRRLVRGAWPYLLWTGLFGLWAVYRGNRPPEVLTDPEKWTFFLMYGKASFHLYFLLVALEAYLVVPLLLPLARRKPPIVLMALLGLALQVAMFFLNRYVLKLQFPASTVLWYLLPILLGIGVGARLSEFAAWWRRFWPFTVTLMVVAYAIYLPTALDYLHGKAVEPAIYSTQSWVFTSLTALNLLGFAYFWFAHPRALTRLQTGLALLGSVSLQVYLLHPVIQQVLEGLVPPSASGSSQQSLIFTAIYGLFSLLLPAALGRWLLGTRLGTLLFGR